MISDDQKRLVFSGRRPYAPQRLALLRLINPPVAGYHVCHHCKGRRRAVSMELDHLNPKLYVTRRLNRFQRLRVIHSEWLAAGATVGQGIVGSCGPCNWRRGGKIGGTGRQPYTGAARRKRGRVGKGYTAGITEHYRRQAEAA